jgi:hypothetical protein
VADGAADWIEVARRDLTVLRGETVGWPYKTGSELAVEPTAFGSLALLTSASNDAERIAARRAAERAARWLVSVRNLDGSLGPTPTLKAPAWPTVPALLLWSVLEVEAEARTAALGYLFAERGKIDQVRINNDVVDHDTTIPGWPWVHDTHPWIEPTALTLIALRRAGQSTHPRFRDGVRLILDRAIVTGGWNYGNRRVFGADLRPHPGPTALAILATVGEPGSAEIHRLAGNHLLEELKTVRSPMSLAWGILALRALNREPRDSNAWLAEADRRIAARPDRALLRALLLLSSSSRTLETLGVSAAAARIAPKPASENRP